MFIRCWGSRGSIPVSGKEYLKYGGNTTCLEIKAESGETIIVDAGSGIRSLGNLLLKEENYKYHIIFTHAHWDHLLGFPFFKPIYSNKTEIDIFGSAFAQDSIKTFLSKTMEAPFFPIDYENIQAKIKYHSVETKNFNIGSLSVESIPISHPNQGRGYKFIEKGSDSEKKVVFLTDSELDYKHEGGLDFNDYVLFSKDANLLIHDAEYAPHEYDRIRGWGHSKYDSVVKLAMEAGVKELALFHHNQDRDDEGVDKFVCEAKEILKKNNKKINCFGMYQGWEYNF